MIIPVAIPIESTELGTIETIIVLTVISIVIGLMIWFIRN